MSTTNPKAPDDSKNSKMTFNDVHKDPSLEHWGGGDYMSNGISLLWLFILCGKGKEDFSYLIKALISWLLVNQKRICSDGPDLIWWTFSRQL